MTGGRRRSAIGRLPAGLLGMVALIAAAEWFVARHDLDLMRFEGWDWRLAPRAAARRAPRCDYLCFGDSLVKFGVLPRVVEARLGRPAHNLAICSGTAATSYFLFRRSLERGARPKAVVVDFMPKILADPPQSRTVAFPWGEFLSPRDGLDLALTARDAEFFGSTMLARALPSVRGRFEIRGNVLAALRGESPSLRPFTPLFFRNWNVNRGAQAIPPNPQFQDSFPDPNAPATAEPWACDPVNAAYCRRFFDLAADRGIPVYWLLTPISPGERARYARLGDGQPYMRFVRRMQAACPNVIVLDGRRSEYRADVFVDRAHLDRRGASALSDDLATLLAHPPAAGTRVVDLPAYRDRNDAAPVEDLTQSALAIQNAGAIRR